VSRRAVLLAAAAIALVAVVVVGLRQAPETKAPTGGDEHPLDPVEVRSRLSGSPPALAALHRQANAFLPGGRAELRRRLDAVEGHPAVVNLWAAWCGPCIVELPVFQQVSLDLGRDVAFLGVNVDDDRARAERLLRRVPVTYPSVEDPDREVFEGYDLLGMPSTVFYDARGEQTYVHQGPYEDRAALVEDVRRYALGEKA
jgi:thiol-disulfide isomerase/thioredoxin